MQKFYRSIFLAVLLVFSAHIVSYAAKNIKHENVIIASEVDLIDTEEVKENSAPEINYSFIKHFDYNFLQDQDLQHSIQLRAKRNSFHGWFVAVYLDCSTLLI